MKKDNKQRLFEVTARLDKTFKPKLNEDMSYDSQPRMIKSQSPRPLNVIAREIYQDWKPVSPYAEQYLDAMSTLNSINDKYMFDSGSEIVARFLSNASQWKGENARRIKIELKKMLGLKEDSTNENTDLSNNNKKTFTLNLFGEDNELYLELNNYRNNNALAVELISTDEEPYATVSVNLPESAELPKDEFFLKNWSENEEIAQQLIEKKIIIPTGKEASSGFIRAMSYKISPEYKSELGEDIDLSNEETPKNEEQEWQEQVESYTNGNITDFTNWLKTLDTGTLIRFLKWTEENNIKF